MSYCSLIKKNIKESQIFAKVFKIWFVLPVIHSSKWVKKIGTKYVLDFISFESM